jgi:hypothetical protein
MHVEPEQPTRRRPRRRILLVTLTPLALPLLVLTGCGGSQTNKSAPQAVNLRIDNSSASGEAGGLLVVQAWIPPPTARAYPRGSGVVVKLSMTSVSTTWGGVVAASTPVAPRVEFSRYGIRQDLFPVPDRGTVVDGTAQLSDITRALRAGERVPLTLRTGSGESLTLQVPVRRPAF